MSAALASGCSIIVKAPEETPASPAQLIRAFADAGVPAGVINLVYGVPSEISEYLIPHPIIRKISFTGSTVVGKQLSALAGLHMKRATMELGGHAPAIVFNDADVTSAAKILSAAKYRNAGQVCISPTRMLVQDDVFREFVDKFVEGARSMKVGNGMDADSKMGSLANPRRVNAIEGMVQDAVGKGAKLETGGHRVGNKGYFYEPTVVSDVPKDARAMNEEPFGPLALISRFSTFDEVAEEANRLPYRAGVLRLHQLDQDRDRDRRCDRKRHGLDQQLWAGAARSAVRRREGFRLRLGRRHRGDGRLFQHQVHHADGGVRQRHA